MSNNSAATQQFERVSEITSVKQMNKWWYIATVKVATTNEDSYNPGELAVLLSKFTNEPDSIQVVTKLGEGFSYYNISGSMGVPYEVIDELNRINNQNE